ncbi:hypothetical protein [Brevibacillus agri]|uniref:hypothetical protein n=1 Tax=Brevibacillus agri TaxID=51101 RepID=UPI0024C09199|nr:hypothetical protein [Brevibacillus agri]MED4569825.1 hypothetical protein [Brevibacillus agri]WHX29943.1 hypothetical protein QNK09_23270 [Brevibacillus agri]
MRKWLLSLLLFILALTACSSKDDVELRWLTTPEAAIQDGLELEGLTKSDVLDEIAKDGETLIIYKMTLPDGTGLGVASLAKTEGKFAWYRTNNPVHVQNNNQEPAPVAKTTVTTRSNKTFTIYLGATRNPNQTIETENGVVTPIIDQKSGLFYCLE